MSKDIELTREQLVRRLILIQEDVENIIEWCKLNGVDTTIDNLHGSSHDTFITNIMIASDVDVEGRCDEDNFRVELEWKCKAMDEETYPIVNCMDCGHPQPLLEENVHVDDLGRHIICEECESSFNVGGDEEPTYQCSKPETHDKVKQIINLLKTLDNGDCVDGETMEYILEKVGMTDQMLRQLVMNNPYTDTSDLLAEKVELDNQRVGRK